MTIPQKIRCRVERIVNHGDRVYTVDLRPEKIFPRFRSGQFLQLALDEYDPSSFWPDSRAFSIASSPNIRDLIRISYSVKGQFTSRMELELYEGKQIWIKLPYGEFVIDQSTDIVLLAGGTGITAFTSFLDSLNTDHLIKVSLIYGVRNPQLLLYGELIRLRAIECPNFRVFYFVESGIEPEIEFGNGKVFFGMISIERVWNMIENPHKSNFYIAGPPVMNKMIAETLCSCGVPQKSIHIDAWE